MSIFEPVQGPSLLTTWSSNAFYQVNSEVMYNGVPYNCVTAHISGSSFDTTKWSQVGVYPPQLSAYVGTIGTASGTDDATTINNLLTTARLAGGGVVKGQQGQHYKLGSPLTVGSGVTLDMTGCTITENAAVNNQMVRNYGYANPAATASDGATTSGSNVVTTSLGASAVVGQTLVVAGAGGNGNGVLVGNVVSATATTITLNTIDGRACNATATVSGASVTLVNRDSSVQVIGGTWNLGSNGPNPYPAILMYHVDGLRVDIEKYTASAVSRGIGIADCSGFFVRSPNISTSSVGVQCTGPLVGGRVDLVRGASTGDDLLAIVAGDYSGSTVMGGDILDVEVGTVDAANTSGNIFKVIAGAGRLVDGVKVTGSICGLGQSNIVYLGDDNASPGTIGGTYGVIDLGLIEARSTNGGPLFLSSPAADQIRARIKQDPIISSGNAVGIGGTSTATIRQLIIEGSSTGTSTSLVSFTSATVTVTQLILEKFLVQNVASNYVGIGASAAATVEELILNECQMLFSGQTQFPIQWNSGTLTRIRVNGGKYVGGANWFNSGVTTATTISFNNGCEISGFGRICGIGSSAVTVLLNHPEFDSTSNGMFYVSGGSYVILGGFTGSSNAALIQRNATESVRVNGQELSVDLSLLTPAEGDLVVNSNGALACGAGLCVHHTGGTGNGWKNVYSGSTY